MPDSAEPSDAPHAHDELVEKERKFLVRDASIVEGSSWKLITQAYFPAPTGYASRVRLVQHLQGKDWVGETAFVAIKGPRLNGQRWEEEYPLKSLVMVKDLLRVAPDVIQKRRFSVIDGGATWEIDVFMGANEGLVIAELEGKGDWIWSVASPEWALREVTHEPRYNNEQLAVRPIRTWAAAPPADDDEEIDWLGE